LQGEVLEKLQEDAKLSLEYRRGLSGTGPVVKQILHARHYDVELKPQMRTLIFEDVVTARDAARQRAPTSISSAMAL